MRHLAILTAIALPLCAYAQDAEPPSRGTGYIITGSIFTGVGLLNFATAPLCGPLTDDGDPETTSDDDAADACFYASLVVGGVGVGVGIPLLVVGLQKRADYRRWEERNPALSRLRVLAGPRGGVVGWYSEF
jgi:hypothetical protein